MFCFGFFFVSDCLVILVFLILAFEVALIWIILREYIYNITTCYNYTKLNWSNKNEDSMSLQQECLLFSKTKQKTVQNKKFQPNETLYARLMILKLRNTWFMHSIVIILLLIFMVINCCNTHGHNHDHNGDTRLLY